MSDTVINAPISIPAPIQINAPIAMGVPGATTYATLTDKATVDLPSINIPLSDVLAGKSSIAYVDGAYQMAADIGNSAAGTQAQLDSFSNNVNAQLSLTAGYADMTTKLAGKQSLTGTLALAGFAGITGTLPAVNVALLNQNTTGSAASLSTALVTSKGGLGADNSAASGVPVFASGVATVTPTTGTGNVLRGNQDVGTGASPTFNGATIKGILFDTGNGGTRVFGSNINFQSNQSSGLGFRFMKMSGSNLDTQTILSVQSSGLNTANTVVFSVNTGSPSSSKLAVLENGNVGIGTTTPAAELDVRGNITASGTVTAAQLSVTSTIAAAGVTGARTQNTGAGAVNFAAAATSLVLTNSLIVAGTNLILTIMTNDSTANGLRAVCGAGFATIYFLVAPTAETKVYWEIRN